MDTVINIRAADEENKYLVLLSVLCGQEHLQRTKIKGDMR